MRLLRTVSTRRLLASIAGLLIAVAGGTAIALAAASGGPVPRPRPLAAAVHDALAAHAPKALSADVTFTDNLVGSSELQGTDPLLSGAIGRLWIDGSHLRLELQSTDGDAQIVAGPHSFWIYDPASSTVYEGSLPAGAAFHSARRSGNGVRRAVHAEAVPSVARIQSWIGKLAARLVISGAHATDVAGRPAYRVTVEPRRHGGLLGRLQLAWDAVRGIPLDFAVYARGNSTPVLELKATSISYGSVPASTFRLTPPSGAKVVRIAGASSGGTAGSAKSVRQSQRVLLFHLGFRVASPARLAGRARESIHAIRWAGKPAVLITYGRGLDSIVVIEHAAGPTTLGSLGGASPSGGGPGLSVPSVRIGAISAQELQTALGTVLEFSRGRVGYLVAGSVPAGAAEAAARGL